MTRTRYTVKDLEALVAEINRETGRPLAAYVDGEPQARCLFVQGAYGGYQIHEMVGNGSSAVRSVTPGYQPARRVAEILNGKRSSL